MRILRSSLAAGLLALLLLANVGLEIATQAAPAGVSFSASTVAVETFDFADVVIQVSQPDARNPFTDVTVSGEFTLADGAPIRVDGFCDAADGSLFRVRFMPQAAGSYRYSVEYRQGDFSQAYRGSFEARNAGRRGQLRTDPQHPEHFAWAGTGERYFWNGTTTYYLMGWEDEEVIRQAIDRLARLKVNRLRVLVYGRNEDRPWGQPVKSTPGFKLYLNPWPAARPDDVKDPGFDLTRFNVLFWQKYERMLRYARERDVIVSVIFFIGGQVLPTPFAAYSEDEQRFYRYGIARLAAFSNVTWDLGNEHNFHREAPKWCDWLGPLVKAWDPYDHLTSAHNVIYRTPGASWADMQLIQRWDAGQNAFMLTERTRQAATGRLIPQINEEYGYEDLWENFPGQRAADTRRRLAWEIAMAGCYQTTGETANRGVGFSPDTGGGWVSGRGDDSMTMLQGYAHMVDFFTSFHWWQCMPRNALVSGGALCLAQEGASYAVYAPKGTGVVSLKLAAGNYQVRAFDPRTGEWTARASASGPVWSIAPESGVGDWAYLLERKDGLVDAAAPDVLTVEATSTQNRIRIQFSEAIDPETAGNVSQYRLAPDREILSAHVDTNEPHVVLLRTAPLQPGATYTLSVAQVADRAATPNVMREPSRKSFEVQDPTRPMVELRFDTFIDGSTPNSGSTARVAGTLTQNGPKKTSRTPFGSGAAIDFGVKPGEHAVEVGNEPLEALRGLKSFTLSGWLNCMNGTVGAGGNRIASTINAGGDGFDLVFLREGQLQLSVNQWPDGLPTHSSPGKVAVDSNGSRENWRFFAVTYDATREASHVRFYFGSPDAPAAPDVAISYARGSVGESAGALAIGHFNRTTRGGNGDRMFRGMLDEIRIHGSKLDGSGALGLEEIRQLQNAK
jgi:hypothetical protein